MTAFKPLKVLHIELSKGIPALHFGPDIQGLYVVFWWHGIPLGHKEIPSIQLPMPETQLAELALKTITSAVSAYLFGQCLKATVAKKNRLQDQPLDFHALMALDRPLEKVKDRLSLSDDVSPDTSISIVICTRNRTERLARCLRSLQQLSHHPQEILVVDNAPSSDAIRHLVAETPDIRYIMEPREGLSIARNTGIRHSAGEIIAFIDDDVTVHSDWLLRLQNGFVDKKVMVVTGLVLPAELETEAQFFFEKYSSFNLGYSPRTFDPQFLEQTKNKGTPVWKIGAGANMAFRRKAFDLVGYFDERLGAGASGCSEDSEFWYRILAGGWNCRYEPAAVVFHYHRRDMRDLKKQMYQYMRGHIAALLIQFDNHHHWGNLYRAFLALPRHYTRLLLRHLLRGFTPKLNMLSAQMLGCASGVKFYLQHRRSPSSLRTSSGIKRQ
jgi:GT2 family glycosyltransferase